MEALERPGCARCLGTCRCHTGESGLCQVFPGIQLRWTDSREPQGGVGGTPSPAAFEIRHCREGGAEWEWGDAYCCLSPGDLAIARQSDMGAEARFPLGRYRGITVTVDLDQAPEDFAAILPEVNVRPRELMEKFTAQGRGYVARSRPAVEHIFSELYDLPESIRAGYCKVKVLELLLFLSALDVEENEEPGHVISRPRMELAQEVARYLGEHMESRVTLEMLSKRFHASGTSIKSSFKAVYGVSLYAYVRTQKMRAAALRLRETEDSVLEIAGALGYGNGSKFAKAFREVMGTSPAAYRRQTQES